MKLRPKWIIIIVLIFLVLGFLFVSFFYHTRPLTGQASLTWKSSDDATVKGYKVYYGTSPRNSLCPSGGYASNIDAGNKTSYVLKGLENGKTYYFSVTSYNDSRKESCFSEEMKKTISISKWEQLKGIFIKK